MMAGPASNMDVKRHNRSNTLRCILTCDRISQMELSQRLGLSWPTVLQNVKELTELGLIREVGSYESTGGRKAKAYAPVRDAKLALRLDITRNHVSVVLVDLSGQVVRSLRKTCPFSLDDDCAKGLGELAERFIADNGAGDPRLEQVWQEYLRNLSVAVNNLHMSFDCDVIVGGYVGAFLEEFGGPLRTLLEERNTFRRDASYLRFCRYKLEAAAVGAALIQIGVFIQTV